MTEIEFHSLANQGYNRIPLISEAFADLETPLSVYLKLAQSQHAGKNTFLLCLFKHNIRPYAIRDMHYLMSLLAYDRVNIQRNKGYAQINLYIISIHYFTKIILSSST